MKAYVLRLAEAISPGFANLYLSTARTEKKILSDAAYMLEEARRDIGRLSAAFGHQGRVTWIEEIRERWCIKP